MFHVWKFAFSADLFFFFKVQPLLKGSSYEHQFFFQGDGYIISLVE